MCVIPVTKATRAAKKSAKKVLDWIKNKNTRGKIIILNFIDWICYCDTFRSWFFHPWIFYHSRWTILLSFLFNRELVLGKLERIWMQVKLSTCRRDVKMQVQSVILGCCGVPGIIRTRIGRRNIWKLCGCRHLFWCIHFILNFISPWQRLFWKIYF